MNSMKTMKMKIAKYLLLALVCLGSCNTPKRITKKLNKFNEAHSEVVAKFTREKFPCITKSADTTISTDTLFQYINVDCPDTSQTIGDTIYLDKVKTIKVRTLVAIPQQTKIINHYIEDSAKIKLMAYDNEQCNVELKKVKKESATYWYWSKRLLILLLLSLILNVLLIRKANI